MTDYRVEGFYELFGDRSPLKGRISIADNGDLVGAIEDYGSIEQTQKIEGMIESKEGITLLSFLKMPRNPDLANIMYLLEKDHDGKNDGTYLGQWFSLPRELVMFAQEEKGNKRKSIVAIYELLPEYDGGEIAQLELISKA